MSAVHKLELKTKKKTKEGDGDENVIIPTDTITIKSVNNGWIITTTFEDGDESVEVFDTDGDDNGNLQTVQCILESMGLEQDIKIR